MKIKYELLNCDDISNYLLELANLRIEVFKEFPYLYEGSIDYEMRYLTRYQKSKNSLVIICLIDNKVVGASTCISLLDEDDDFKSPFLNKEWDIAKIYYFGESIIKKDYRGNKIGHEFFRLREEFAKEKLQQHLKFTTFCSVIRKENHSKKPHEYRPLDNFWKRLGYSDDYNLFTEYSWKDIDKKIEDSKKMKFWIKAWN